jgi:hypothetical protein
MFIIASICTLVVEKKIFFVIQVVQKEVNFGIVVREHLNSAR